MTVFPGAITAAISFVLAGSSPAPGPSLHERIDALIAAGQTDYQKQVAPISSDAEFLRRVTLDLTGTLPTADDARAFVADTAVDKRVKLIDRLISSPGYARRMAWHFDVVFMERLRDSKVPRAVWETYLRESFAENKPYDQLAREILSADGADPKNRAPAKFFLERNLEPNAVTRDIGRVFLGRDLQCAQCHDHPLIEDYKQEDYYGLLAFVNRSYLFPNANVATAIIAEKAEGDVTFTSVFDEKKLQKSTGPKLPDGQAVAEPKLAKGEEYKVKPAKNVRPVPVYSRREQLARLLASNDNPAFARTAVNRIWALMMGRGLVHPLDMDHPDNPPSHPELLDLLAEEFTARKFDVRWLVREIALTQTYQRSSEAPTGADDLPPDRYLVALLKPLSAEQLAYAVLQATGQTDAERLALGAKLTEAALDAKLAPRVNPFRAQFGGPPGEPFDGSGSTLGQVLFLKHGAAIRGMIASRRGNLADRLGKLTDSKAIADELFLSVLTRLPTDEERADVAAVLADDTDRPTVLTGLIWALVASAEFRFNH